ncbi:hypothetical protein [Micromonospora nigra]|uniref:hypothetical protein n=1 Tax=Micromonospora nigra TaxID=145857 RepID=UPI000B839C39|nr:hypothetical protein [Micromonospora nigra]
MVGLAALVLPVVWVVRRQRKPRPAAAPLSAEEYAAAYELGREDERARAAQADRSAARVLPFERRKPPTG